MGFKQLIPIILIAVLLLLGSQFMIYQLGSVEAGSNVTGEYLEQMNSTRDSSIVTISVVKLIAPILGVVALMIAIGTIVKRKR
ncbi:MAG: hypothetical protein Q8L68_03100 [Methylococcales bacterium]|nr:hypothetical protein [Methylococcales bacterium]